MVVWSDWSSNGFLKSIEPICNKIPKISANSAAKCYFTGIENVLDQYRPQNSIFWSILLRKNDPLGIRQSKICTAHAWNYLCIFSEIYLLFDPILEGHPTFDQDMSKNQGFYGHYQVVWSCLDPEMCLTQNPWSKSNIAYGPSVACIFTHIWK